MKNALYFVLALFIAWVLWMIITRLVSMVVWPILTIAMILAFCWLVFTIYKALSRQKI